MAEGNRRHQRSEPNAGGFPREPGQRRPNVGRTWLTVTREGRVMVGEKESVRCQMKHARNTRKALVIVSDGGDNRSRHTEREIKNAMLESDVQVYAMGIFDPEDTRKHSLEEQNGPKLLEQLAEQTGGREYPVTSLDDLPAISARIGNQLRNQYLLGYSPANSERDGKYRTIHLSVAPNTEAPDLRIYYRHGYYAPAL